MIPSIIILNWGKGIRVFRIFAVGHNYGIVVVGKVRRDFSKDV
jgi:hypothetical protein